MSFPQVTIDGGALRSNLAVVRRLAPDSRVVAAIKANAYGHGLIPAARALAGADAFGLARIDEALKLREAGIDKQLLLLEGVTCADHLAAAGQHQLDIVVHSSEQIEMLEAYDGAHRFAVWLKLDTGMNRLGFRIEDISGARERLARSAAVGHLRFMTHLASAEHPDDSRTKQQIEAFIAAASSFQLERSIANSAGLIGWPQTRVEWVRPGLMLYGISPMTQTSAQELGLQPVMTLTTQLIAVRRVIVGETVGYNGIWRAQQPSLIGIAAIGYGDGYPRGMRNGAPVLINGREAPVAGRVSMDMTAIDLTDLPDAKAGDLVTLWGEGLPVERVAACADTIPYELTCRINARVEWEWRR